ncbi:hypothetical protein W97_03269 [Coniosporium apollinis CBS 100218]|uniref:Kinetochore protein fta4 n=1 Tax=Coniosporium apollinis (strain CBS 100218) TaxID=1168221 RepID=R7YQE2_CONA1|nr:uncharacterized protein W97_03269 [Coniosporium apollinis CBS 100218]EON64039.1 hypothetical protein W97_03269 [Coniosporium apollinis CBS 100218]
MSATSNTVVALKTSFLRTQTRILSQPLQPSDRWRDSNHDVGGFSEANVKEAIREVNRLLRRHSKSAYSSIAIRHIAEQIDKLYWEAGAPDPHADEALSQSGITPDDDLTSDETISRLPETWEESSPRETEDADGNEIYASLLTNLHALSARRAALRKKIQQYRHLQSLLEPFKDPHENIQPNLVTRDAALATELTKMRTLSARVAGRVAGIGEAGGGAEIAVTGGTGWDGAGLSTDEKLQRILQV